ncbi:hypothetical protein BKN38_02325 [Helicobacter sp. CLO-3]|nr:hypothetical protein BA723_00705 [Helicobacter sp. CLO-3]OHU84649.1 hypothetical protein BKN38_02325 [Helicobacter sp. CLO-3]
MRAGLPAKQSTRKKLQNFLQKINRRASAFLRHCEPRNAAKQSIKIHKDFYINQDKKRTSASFRHCERACPRSKAQASLVIHKNRQTTRNRHCEDSTNPKQSTRKKLQNFLQKNKQARKRQT